MWPIVRLERWRNCEVDKFFQLCQASLHRQERGDIKGKVGRRSRREEEEEVQGGRGEKEFAGLWRRRRRRKMRAKESMFGSTGKIINPLRWYSASSIKWMEFKVHFMRRVAAFDPRMNESSFVQKQIKNLARWSILWKLQQRRWCFISMSYLLSCWQLECKRC